MSKVFYPKLAWQNIRKNSQTYASYMITCILTIAVFYIMSALTVAPEMDQFFGGENLRIFLFYGQWTIGIFAFIFLFYTHSFIVKRRKREFGLYNILGMEKKHIALVMVYETFYCALISFVLGIGLGVALYKAAQLLLFKLVHIPVQMGFYVSGSTIKNTLILFGIIFVLTFLNTLRQLHLSSPIELLKGGQVGEKEPKARILLVLLGLACLGGGYYISITATSPMETIGLFFVAVIMVIVGTYCLFTSITIAVLKMLRKNRKYYYNPRHFTFVSGMLYRMKQNAVGLANICILSTMVLVMLSTSIVLYVSMEDLIRNGHPRNMMIDLKNVPVENVPEVEAYIDQVLEDNKLQPLNLQRFSQLSLMMSRDGNQFNFVSEGNYYANTQAAATVVFLTLTDYNEITGDNKTLENPQDVLLYTTHSTLSEDTIKLGDSITLNIAERIEGFDAAQANLIYVADYFYVIVKDSDIMNQITDIIPEYLKYGTEKSYCYYFDLDMDKEGQQKVYQNLLKILLTEPAEGSPIPQEGNHHISSSEESRDSYYAMYGGLLFIGIFLGSLFLMATVLIIYYKQLTEGYEDQFRFEIMQNVGMSNREVKKAIHSQVLSVFYLPLGMACVHTAFAFPIVSRLLTMLSMTNMKLFLLGMIGTIVVFAIFYTIIYAMTAKVYLKIVSAKK